VFLGESGNVPDSPHFDDGAISMSVTTDLLGYPPDARLLIVNADDFGMYQGINQAVNHACSEGIVQSRTLMTPCVGAAEAKEMLEANPEIPSESI